MGPHSIECGMALLLALERAVIAELLQWGRTLSSAEWGVAAGAGPPYLRRGWLQWGRTLSSAECRDGFSKKRWISPGFNGAALYRVRNGRRFRGRTRRPWCFNGAALYRVRNVPAQNYRIFKEQLAASRAPRGFHRRITASANHVHRKPCIPQGFFRFERPPAFPGHRTARSAQRVSKPR